MQVISRETLKRTSDRQKRYANLHQSSQAFKARDKVFLRVKPKRSSLQLGKYKKLAYRYCGTYEILGRIGEQSYELALPTHLHVHNVSHASLLKNYVANPNHVLNLDDTILVNQEVYHMEPDWIVDVKEKKLRHRTIREALV